MCLKVGDFRFSEQNNWDNLITARDVMPISESPRYWAQMKVSYTTASTAAVQASSFCDFWAAKAILLNAATVASPAS